MFTFILSTIIGWIIYEKFFRVNYATGEDYLKRISELPYYEMDNEIEPVYGYLPMWNWTSHGIRYYADMSDILGVRPYTGRKTTITPNGVYSVICTSEENRDSHYTIPPADIELPYSVREYEYVKYIPKRCQFCGKEIKYMPAMHVLTGGPIQTGIVPSSESRYCEHCREILTHKDTETFIPFYIHEFGNERKKLVTVRNDKFKYYMQDCKRMGMLDEEVERVGYAEIAPIYDRLASLRTLTEYSKNIDGVNQWELFKGLR